MILGLWQKGRSGAQLRQELLEGLARVFGPGEFSQAVVWDDQDLACCWRPEGLDTMDEPGQPFVDAAEDVILMFQGKIYNRSQLGASVGFKKPGGPSSGQVLVDLFHRRGESFLEPVNGKFAFAMWNRKTRTLLLGRDRLGIEPLFYRAADDRLFFGTSLTALLAAGWTGGELNERVILQYLLFCYNPDQETFLRGTYKLPAGHLLRAGAAGISLRRYWQLSFAHVREKTEQTYAQEILDLIGDAIRIRSEPIETPGVFLSGGTDSSTLVSLTSRIYDQPLPTLSFRCRGKSFDESSWAQFVADRFGTRHTLVPFDAADVLLIDKAVLSMNEPFSDVGIEIGTYLLGRAASGQVSYVFSGEGGDEAFGGHPVYQADKVAALVDWMPGFLLRPAIWSLHKLPDSDQKKNLQVKAKRFAQSLAFPAQLLSHRWRIYYTLEGIKELCDADFLAGCDLKGRYDGILRQSREADGPDDLSRSLYSDYGTLVDFYLRRLQLLRAFSVESRLPLLDHRLVEYAATIPSRLKVRRFGETKYLYKRVLAGIIPNEILYGRPKLGHSVPLKNWLREDQQVQQFVREHLRGGVLQQRGFFHQRVIDHMIDEHIRRVDNHSHRLWALVVLELWLRAHMTGSYG